MTNTKRVTVMGLIAERDAARMAARHESDRILKMLAAEVDRLPSGLTVPVLQMLSNELKTLSGRAASAAKESERE